MTATYPTQVKTFNTHNTLDVINAGDPNAIQDEVVALESTVGANPTLSTTPATTGWNGTSYTYSTVSARIANVELGVVGDSHTQYLRKSADSANVITPSASNIKAAVFKAASGQSVNLVEFQNSSGTPVTYIDSNGNLQGFSVSGTITIGSTAISLNGTATTIAGLTLTAPVINNGTISGATYVTPPNSQTGTTYTAAAIDAYSFTLLSNAAAIAVTIPQNNSGTNGFGSGTQLNFAQMGAGQVTISGGTGVTLLSTAATPAAPKLRLQYSVATAVQTNVANTWIVTGDIS